MRLKPFLVFVALFFFSVPAMGETDQPKFYGWVKGNLTDYLDKTNMTYNINGFLGEAIQASSKEEALAQANNASKEFCKKKGSQFFAHDQVDLVIKKDAVRMTFNKICFSYN